MDRLHSMQVFCSVIDRRGFAAAAREMRVSPSVVTRLITDLETHLGVRLINRTTRKLVLTEAGELYLEQVRRILADINEAEASVRSTSAALCGHLKVLAPPAFASHQLAKILTGFRQRYPKVSIALAAPGNVETLDESYDISLIAAGETPLDGQFIARQLACSKIIMCASPAYLGRMGKAKTPQDLVDHELIVPAFVRELVFRTDAMQADGSPVESVAFTASQAPLATAHLDMAYASVLAGLGIAFLPSYVVADALADQRLVRVLPQWHLFVITVYAAMATRKHVPAKTRAFLDYLVEVFPGGAHDPWLGESPTR